MRLRIGIALSLGITAAVVVHFWPGSPRMILQPERGAWHMAFSPDGTLLALLDREPGVITQAQVLLWDAGTGALLHRLDCGKVVYPHRVVFAPDGNTIGMVDAGGVVTKWDVVTGQLRARYDHGSWPHDLNQFYGLEVLFSPEGRWLLHNAYAGCVHDVETGDVVHDYDQRWPDRNLHVHGGCVAARVDGVVRTFDALTGAALASFPSVPKGIPMSRMGGNLFSADGTLGVYFSDANRWVIHNARTGTECRLAGDDVFFNDIKLSPDHRMLAVTVVEGDAGLVSALHTRMGWGAPFVRVVDAATGSQVGTAIPTGLHLCFAPDGKTLAVTDHRGISLWDVPSPSRWPTALGLGILAMSLPFAPRLLRRRARPVARP